MKKSNWTLWKLTQMTGLATLMFFPIYSSELVINFSLFWAAYFAIQFIIYVFLVKILIMPDAYEDRGRK